MSRRGRLLLFGCAGSGLLAVLVIGLHGLPPFGGFHGAYGLLVDRLEPGRRHATDIVTALNFDLRAFDTLGEEFILFASVTAVALLLRHLRDEDDEPPRRSLDDHRFAGASDALRVLSLILIPLLVSLGVYLALHGALTPGGGFQAGVVLAAGPLAILLAGRYLALKRVAPQWALEALDGIGALGWLLAVFAIVSALTAGAVLRVAGRVFYGWGPSEGPDSRQARAAHERVDETREDRGRTPPLSSWFRACCWRPASSGAWFREPSRGWPDPRPGSPITRPMRNGCCTATACAGRPARPRTWRPLT